MTSEVKITSIPKGAKIFINGEDTLKITPSQFTFEPGFHTYHLSAHNYEPVLGSINIENNEFYSLIISLTASSTILYQKIIYIGIIALCISTISLIKHKIK
ncbi:MAG: PEGA domain-containing protein [Bacteroidota bacterium]